MNKKAVLLGFSLLLSACVTAPDSRPEPFLKSEALLQKGLIAYQNDNFSEAMQLFNQALKLYQSFDNHKGMALTRLNLLETALAISDFANASLYLKQLQQQETANDLGADRYKVQFLQVKLQFEQQDYRAALLSLKPLLAVLDGQWTIDDNLLKLLAMQARLEVLIAPLEQSDGLIKFEAALAKTEPKPEYQALLNRILAVTALKRADYATATTLLTQALAYYQEQANRRSIAACLEELAEVEIALKHQQQARDYLDKALLIRQWLKNDYKSDKIKQRLATIHQTSAR